MIWPVAETSLPTTTVEQAEAFMAIDPRAIEKAAASKRLVFFMIYSS